jgi:type IV pilus assembly protein PilC
MRLEAGYPLYQALLSVPGVASRETIMAAAIGQSTGQLARCLNLVPGWRLSRVWIDAIPKVLYPLFVLLFMMAATSFLLIFIVPKFEKIFADFSKHMPGFRLPEETELFISVGRWFVKYALLVVASAFAVVALLIASSTACWYCPGVSRLYRMHARGRLLRMLAIMLDAGDTVPEALTLLVDSRYFKGTVQRRLRKVRAAIEHGEPLPESLHREGLLPNSMLPLLQAAERARNLPWAMLELGDHLGRRSVNLSERITAAVFPLTVILTGIVVGFVIIALFMPLVTLITELAL